MSIGPLAAAGEVVTDRKWWLRTESGYGWNHRPLYGWYPDMHFESGIVLTFKVTYANLIIEKKVIDD